MINNFNLPAGVYPDVSAVTGQYLLTVLRADSSHFFLVTFLRVVFSFSLHPGVGALPTELSVFSGAGLEPARSVALTN